MVAGRSAVISCSKIASDTSSTTRTQTELPFGGAAMSRVSTPLVAMAKLAPLSVKADAPVASLATNCQRVWVLCWKPMPMQFTTGVKGIVSASAGHPNVRLDNLCCALLIPLE